MHTEHKIHAGVIEKWMQELTTWLDDNPVIDGSKILDTIHECGSMTHRKMAQKVA